MMALVIPFSSISEKPLHRGRRKIVGNLVFAEALKTKKLISRRLGDP
jgi:hypothetical protein